MSSFVPGAYNNNNMNFRNSDLNGMDRAVNREDEPQLNWWEYLGYDDEEEYNRKVNILQALKIKNNSDVNVYYLDDASSDFFGYSYEEIINMYENGTYIPDEILNWAMSMAQNNPTTEDVQLNYDDAEALYMSLKQNPDINLKTISNIFIQKCMENTLDLEKYKEEMVSLQKDVSVLKSEIEMIKEDIKRQIAPMKDEWEGISYKLRNGIPLTEEENKRANYLREQFGALDEDYKNQIYSKIVNLGYYIDKIGEVSHKLEIANSFSRVTKLILEEMSDPEVSSADKSIISTNSYNLEEEFSYDNLSTNYTNGLYNSVYTLDSRVSDVVYRKDSIQNTLNEIAEIGGFKLDDPNHNINTSFSDDIDFTILDNSEVQSEDTENVVETDGNEEDNEIPEDNTYDFEDITLELPLYDEVEPEPEYGYNPEGAKNLNKNYFNYVKTYFKPAFGADNKHGSRNPKK